MTEETRMTKSKESPESEFRTGAVSRIAPEWVVFGLAALVFVWISSLVIQFNQPFQPPANDAKTCSLLYQRFDWLAIRASFVKVSLKTTPAELDRLMVMR